MEPKLGPLTNQTTLEFQVTILLEMSIKAMPREKEDKHHHPSK